MSVRKQTNKFIEMVEEGLVDPRISREHIRIDYENKKYFLSLAKTQVNVTKLNEGAIAGNEKFSFTLIQQTQFC